MIPKKNIDATLNRSTRVRKSTIPSDYIVYLQECDYNIGAENDPETLCSWKQMVRWMALKNLALEDTETQRSNRICLSDLKKID